MSDQSSDESQGTHDHSDTDSPDSHIAHIHQYFEQHEHWNEDEFSAWCRQSDNPKFAVQHTIHCYWVNSLKNFSRAGNALAATLLQNVHSTKNQSRKLKRKRRKSLPTTRRGSVYIHANTYVTGHHNPVNISQSKPTEPNTGPRDHMSCVVLREAELHVLNLSDSQVRISVAEFQQYSSRSPVVPKSSEFEDALALFRNSPDLRPENPDLVNMWCWIRRVHENLQLLSDKLKPHWSSFLTEGFFDANVWGPMIDSLWLGEQDMILVRKEVELLRKDEKRKLDGLIRYGDGVREFDVGVLEVSKPERPKSNQKTVIDMHKVTHAMAVILFDLRRVLEHRSPVERSSLQVIGFVCSGWGCVVLRMWCDGSTFIVKAKSFALVFGRGLEPNVEFLRTLVRYRDLARLTVSTVSYQAESDL